MVAERYIVSLQNTRSEKSAGNKALNLKKLNKEGFLIPRSYICTWEAYKRYVDGENNLDNDLKRELTSSST